MTQRLVAFIIILIVAMFALAVSLYAKPAQAQTLWSDAIPPERYQKEAGALVFFRIDVSQLCGQSGHARPFIACQAGETIVLPMPCPYAATETYARIVCHEIGHRSGWPASHGE